MSLNKNIRDSGQATCLQEIWQKLDLVTLYIYF